MPCNDCSPRLGAQMLPHPTPTLPSPGLCTGEQYFCAAPTRSGRGNQVNVLEPCLEKLILESLNLGGKCSKLKLFSVRRQA